MRLDMSVCVGTGPRGQVNPSGHMWHKVGKVTSVSAVVQTWGSRVSPNIGDPLPFIIPNNNPFITTSMLCVNLNYPSNSTWPSFWFAIICDIVKFVSSHIGSDGYLKCFIIEIGSYVNDVRPSREFKLFWNQTSLSAWYVFFIIAV